MLLDEKFMFSDKYMLLKLLYFHFIWIVNIDTTLLRLIPHHYYVMDILSTKIAIISSGMLG